jgi:nucleotide-binding universal stress UspA family protein
MKTLLVPTDFSAIAQNAIDYAIEIATLTKSKIILFHAYQMWFVN